MKYVIIFFSALIIEIASTFYISYVSERNLIGMVIFACLGPFLSLPFAGFMVDSKNWLQRIKLAICLSFGYGIGAFIVYFFKF
jgi:hypothetical protein